MKKVTVPQPAGIFTPTPTCLAKLTPTSTLCACRIGRGEPYYCVVTHRSGADSSRRLVRDRRTDPKPEPKPQPYRPPKPKAKETRRERRARLYGHDAPPRPI